MKTEPIFLKKRLFLAKTARIQYVFAFLSDAVTAKKYYYYRKNMLKGALRFK